MFTIRYRYAFILLLAVYSFLNIFYTVGEKLFDFYIPALHLFTILTVVVFGVWELNRVVAANLSNLHKALSKKVHPLIIQFALSLPAVALVCFLSMFLVYLLTGMPLQVNKSHLVLLSAFGFRVNLFLNCLNAIVFYMNKLKQVELEAEQFKMISAEAQFESLRNQINPHFLFNSFNVLSTLVYKDADTSAQFIAQLSNVYRYLLNNHQKKIVPLQDEIDFINSYLFLLKIRFGENIIIEHQLNSDQMYYVAPAVLQMLIENATKHNVISKKNPLRVTLKLERKAIVVMNSLLEKNTKEDSSSLGLLNIQRRYAFLTDEKVIVEKTETEFKVTIPLLELEE